MTRTDQLPLDLGHRPTLGRDDFLVAACNAEAVAWLDRWPDWPAPAVAVYGPEGCGKSHLAQVFAARSGALVLTAAALRVDDPPRLLAMVPAVVVEDGDRGVDETALFHLYNLAKEQGCTLLLTGRPPPAQWPLSLPDLRSRLNAIPAIGIAPPDDALIAGLLVKLFADRQLRIGHEVVAYLLARMERSFAAAHAVVEALDRSALAEKREITVPLARRVLETTA